MEEHPISHFVGRQLELVASDLRAWMALLTYNCGGMTLLLVSGYGVMMERVVSDCGVRKELVASDCDVRKERLKLTSFHYGVKMERVYLAFKM